MCTTKRNIKGGGGLETRESRGGLKASSGKLEIRDLRRKTREASDSARNHDESLQEQTEKKKLRSTKDL